MLHSIKNAVNTLIDADNRFGQDKLPPCWSCNFSCWSCQVFDFRPLGGKQEQEEEEQEEEQEEEEEEQEEEAVVEQEIITSKISNSVKIIILNMPR